MVIRELDQTLHELRPGTGDFRAVVEIDQQAADPRIHGPAVGPPQLQTIRYEVACVSRCAKDHVQLTVLHFQNACRREHRQRLHVVVGRMYGGLPTGHAATRERSDLHLSLGVERNAERFKIMNGLRMDLLQVREDRVSFRDLFWGLLLRTRRNR